MKNKDGRNMKSEMEYRLQRMLAREKERRRKQEIELWKRAGAPCLLAEALSRKTKYELDVIRKAHGLPGMSALNKADLTRELSMRIPMAMKNLLSLWDEERYEVLQRVQSHGGLLPYEEISPHMRRELQKHGILFHGIHEGNKVLFLPEDLTQAWRALDHEALLFTLKRNTEWILLTQGLLYYIGVDEYWNVLMKISRLMGEDIEHREYTAVINGAADCYGELRISGAMNFHKDVKALSKVLNEQKKRREVPPYPFTKVKLRKAGKPGYIEKTPEIREFLYIIRDAYALT